MKVVFFDLETTGTLVNKHGIHQISGMIVICLLYTSPSPRDRSVSRMPSSA